jgi:hypothetical protein
MTNFTNVAPMAFLYTQAYLRYDLSNIGSNFMKTKALRDPETETEVFINCESRPKFGLNFFRDWDPDCPSRWTFLFNLAPKNVCCSKDTTRKATGVLML